MSAQRKYVSVETPLDAAPNARPRLADTGDTGGMNPALAAQRLQLAALLTDDEPKVARYSGATRLAIVVGGSGALWAIAAAGAWRLLSAL